MPAASKASDPRASAGSEVEAEPVDVHLLRPVAQRVGDQRERAGVPQVEGVAAAGVVLVEPTVSQPVVAVVVQAAPGQRRAVVAALAGVVVDHVEHDLEPGVMHRPHHRGELAHLLAPRPGRRVAGVRGEETKCVVAPVVGQSLFQQRWLGHVVVHRQQLHGRDAKRGEVLEHGRVAEPRVGAAQRLGHIGVTHGEAAHVQLVEDGVRPGDGWCSIAGPVEPRVHDHRSRYERRRVLCVEHGVIEGGVIEGGVTEGTVLARARVVEQGGVESYGAVDGSGIGVGEQLGGVEPVAVPRVPGPVHPVAVALPRPDTGQVRVPHAVGAISQPYARLAPGVVVQAQVHGLAGAPDGERRAAVLGRGAQRRRPAGGDGHAWTSFGVAVGLRSSAADGPRVTLWIGRRRPGR